MNSCAALLILLPALVIGIFGGVLIGSKFMADRWLQAALSGGIVHYKGFEFTVIVKRQVKENG